jgi:membrane-associated protease RseP (regulator of RpoE activity)
MDPLESQSAGSPPESQPVFLHYSPAAAPPRPIRYRLNLLLFGLTILSTWLVGMELGLSFRLNGPTAEAPEFFGELLHHPGVLLYGLPFMVALLGILMAHEMGHYLACRYYGIDATLPFFIPFPNLIGTLGAFIRIRTPFQNRRALFDVGIAGPLAGFVLALPTLLLSMPYSRLVQVRQMEMGISLGEPILFKLIAKLYGIQAPAGMDVYLHPVAFAAWVGFFATALNLLPMGQLDGGHIIYALLGTKHRWTSLGFVFLVIPVLMFFWTYWVIWALIPLFLGLNHPPTLDDSIPLDRKRKVLALIAGLIFIFCFMPAPLQIK